MMRGLLLVFSLGGSQQDRAADRWFAQDKLKHFVTAAVVQGLGYGALRAAGVPHGVALGGASVGTATVSVGKELWDRAGHGTPSWRDLAWDAAGAGSESLLLVRVAR